MTEWFNTGTAAVKFAKAVLSLLAFLGVITVGGLGINTIVNGGHTLSSSLLQPCDLGACDVSGWTQAQASSSSGVQPCPTFPQNARGHVSTDIINETSRIEVFEDVWQVTDPEQNISTFANTAQGCSFTNSQGSKLTWQTDDSADNFGNDSAVFTVGVTGPTAFANATPTIGAYDALIAHGNLVAQVYVNVGTEGTISESMLSSILTAATRRLS